METAFNENAHFCCVPSEQYSDKCMHKMYVVLKLILVLWISVGPLWSSGKADLGTGGSQVRNSIPLKIRRVWGLLHAKSYVVAKRPLVSVARKFGEGDASSGAVHVI
ncbi:hypothetical protein AVEN_163342-1 [Araneus ventricosus]|uniref:Uncharacterized protein n=1 Tax=Araneus ventricosus TaxID=182803 RepID=A0A4Y2U394_ARAVE|nr:hypothetical protein AVEN_163342-1 [Araneus ventricosus]